MLQNGHANVPIKIWEATAKTGDTLFENTVYWEQAITALGEGRYPSGRLRRRSYDRGGAALVHLVFKLRYRL